MCLCVVGSRIYYEEDVTQTVIYVSAFGMETAGGWGVGGEGGGRGCCAGISWPVLGV